MRLKPIEKDRRAFLLTIYERQNEFNGISNVIENYKIFVRKIKQALRDGLTIEKIYNAFMRLNIVTIELEGSDKENDPQVVFESINATGLHLNGLDLIRNFLMMGESYERQEYLFKTYWEKLESNLKKEEYVTSFILQYLRIYFGANIKKDEVEIYETFKKLSKTRFDNDRESMMQDMLKFSQNYAVLIISEARHFLANPYNVPSHKIDMLYHKLRVFQKLGFSLSYPFLMILLDDFHAQKLNIDDFEEILNVILSYLVRRNICSLKVSASHKVLCEANNYLKTMSANTQNDFQAPPQNPPYHISLESVEKYLGSMSGEERAPTDIEVESKFGELKASGLKEILLFILWQIECASNETTPSMDNLDIEYVFPQVPTQNWLESLNNETQSQILQVYVHTFGNLTLIEKGKKTHKKIDDSPASKMQFLSESSQLVLNAYFSALDCFDLEAIRLRSENLCKKFLEIFSDIPHRFRTKQETHTLESSWTYLRPTELVLPSGEVKKVKTYKNVAREIISYLLTHYKDEVYCVMENVDFIKDNDEKKSCAKESSFVFEDFGDFAFYCKAEADTIRKHLKTLVEGVNNEDCKTEHFEIRGYMSGQ